MSSVHRPLVPVRVEYYRNARNNFMLDAREYAKRGFTDCTAIAVHRARQYNRYLIAALRGAQ